MSDRPISIGPKNFELWTARITLDPSWGAVAIQQVVTKYVTESGITVVGYHTPESPALTLLRWPDTRPDFESPTIEQCNTALVQLAGRLGANALQKSIVPEGMIHTMMGRKKDGYEDGKVVLMEKLRSSLPGYSITEGHMISARVKNSPDGKREIESYDEPVGILVVNHADKHLIHKVGDELEQHHYAMEIGPVGNKPGRTEFYETWWYRRAAQGT